jgi:hypothetical protein
MQQGISAAVGINSANGWYPAGLDLFLCLLCSDVEPSEELWQDVSPLIATWPARRAASPYKATQPRLCAGRRRGTGGGLRPCQYVKGIQKFLPVFKASTEVMLGRADNRGQREPECPRLEHGALRAYV